MKLKHTLVALLALVTIPLAPSEAANLPPVLRQRYFDANGEPLAGGLLYSYQAGTTTPQATYTDSSGATPNANPIVLDANGEARMWLDPTLSYKFVLQDSDAVTQWTEDNVVGLLTADAVVTASLQDDSVTLAKIADDAVGADQLRDSASIDLDRAVTTSHIRDSAITTAKIADSNVTTAKIADGNVTTAKIDDGDVTQAKLAARTVSSGGSDPGAGGICVSASSSTFSTTSTTLTDVTNLTCTLTTTGRPVRLELVHDGSGDTAFLGNNKSGAVGTTFQVAFLRGASVISLTGQGMTQTSGSELDEAFYPPGAFSTLDTSAAGTYTYKVQVKARFPEASPGGTENVEVYRVKLVAYEL
jgi:hypothetical protein